MLSGITALSRVFTYSATKAAVINLTQNLAREWAAIGIRVNALSPGPIATRAASGIAHFDDLIDQARARAPERQLVSIREVGDMAAFLISDRARSITGDVTYIDAGFHIMS